MLLLVRVQNQEDNMFHFCLLSVSNFVFCATEDASPKGKESGDPLRYVLYPIDSETLCCPRICSFSVKEKYHP